MKSCLAQGTLVREVTFLPEQVFSASLTNEARVLKEE